MRPEGGKEERSVVNPAREEEIKRRAYEIYLERGEEPGRDLEDWLPRARVALKTRLEHQSASFDVKIASPSDSIQTLVAANARIPAQATVNTRAPAFALSKATADVSLSIDASR